MAELATLDMLAWLALVNSKGEGDSPKEDPVDFLGEEEESINTSALGEDMVRSVDPNEEAVNEFLLLPLTSSHSPSLESELLPVKGMDLI